MNEADDLIWFISGRNIEIDPTERPADVQAKWARIKDLVSKGVRYEALENAGALA